MTKANLQSRTGKMGGGKLDKSYEQFAPKPRYIEGMHEPSRSRPHGGQIKMKLKDGFEFMADKNMVPILTSLNDAGIRTYSHCAGHGEHQPAWVVVELDGLDVEVRPARLVGNGAPRGAQVLLRWNPTWAANCPK